MSRYWNNYTRYSQPSAEQLRRNIEATKAKAEKAGRKLEPIQASDINTICSSWWGLAWCNNLEQYAEFKNRIGRGMEYIVNGTLLDLQIKRGEVDAIVQGSKEEPYKVQIIIKPLSKRACNNIKEKCGKRIENLESLVGGQFPEELEELFTGKGGLFPSPKEIEYKCSCPDSVKMCKHIIAVIYGIGIRLDKEPLELFELRGMDAKDLVATVVDNRLERMIANVNKDSDRIIKDADLTELFGVL